MNVTSDLERARKMVDNAGSFVGAAGTLPENVAIVVADGIALGRQEGLELAAEALETEVPALADRIRELTNSN